MTGDASADSLVAKARQIAPIIREYAAEAERQRCLSLPVVDAMVAAGLYSMSRPKAFGGLESDPVTMFRVVEEIGRHDSAAAWNLQLSLGVYPFLAWLPDKGAAEILSSNPAGILGGSFSPAAPAIATDGGYLLSGQRPFVSGVHQCHWLVFFPQVLDRDAMRVNDKGVPLQWFMFLPADEVKILDTWNTLGMRGTGSHDVLIEKAFIPERRTALVAPLEKPGEAFQGPLYRLTVWVPIALLASPALGVARAAIDTLIELARIKTPSFTPSTLARRQVAQRQVAQAEATLGAGRSYLFETFRESWTAAVNREPITEARKIKMPLAASHAMACAAKAVDLVHAAAGTSAIRNEKLFQQHFRDVHTMSQHAFASASRYESVGALMFGVESDWGFFPL
jgi:alkylation response protein AidB-like acyl-CoA dehydrogenase